MQQLLQHEFRVDIEILAFWLLGEFVVAGG